MTRKRLRRVLVDSDGGIDDAVALHYLLGCGAVQLAGVTSVHGNVDVERATGNLLSILALAGAHDVPVAKGAAQPRSGHRPARPDSPHGPDGLRGAQLPQSPSSPTSLTAHEFLAGRLRDSRQDVELLAIGPLTNVAALLDVADLPRRRITRIVIMGGDCRESAAPEFNLTSDPDAARLVMQQPDVPVLQVPYDVTQQVDDSWHDAVAAVALVRPDLFTVDRRDIDVVRRCDVPAVRAELDRATRDSALRRFPQFGLDRL